MTARCDGRLDSIVARRSRPSETGTNRGNETSAMPRFTWTQRPRRDLGDPHMNLLRRIVRGARLRGARGEAEREAEDDIPVVHVHMMTP